MFFVMVNNNKKPSTGKKATFQASKWIEDKIKEATMKVELRDVSRNLLKDFDAELFEGPKKVGGFYTELSDYEKKIFE